MDHRWCSWRGDKIWRATAERMRDKAAPSSDPGFEQAVAGVGRPEIAAGGTRGARAAFDSQPRQAGSDTGADLRGEEGDRQAQHAEQPSPPTVVVARSSIHGWGVLAARRFTEGEIVLGIDDSGVVDNAHPLRPKLGDDEVYCDYLSGGRVVLMQPPERHINSSCDPNTYIKTIGGVRRVLALRGIEQGDEITYDYIINCDGGEIWQCSCGSPRCRGSIVGSFFDLPLARQLEYLPLLDTWFMDEHADRVEELRCLVRGERAARDDQ